jgi:hypothetical protein
MSEKFRRQCKHQFAFGTAQGRRAVRVGDAKAAAEQVLHYSDPLLPVAPPIELYL